MLAWLVSFAAAALISYGVTPMVARYHRSRGLLGVDVHKRDKPAIPEAGGLALLVSITAASLVLVPLGTSPRVVAAFLLVVIAVGLSGYVDDRFTLDARSKTLLPLIAGLPVVLLEVYDPRPYVPFAGQARLTLLYPLLALVFITISANAVNMADTHNGVAPLTSLMTALAILVGGLVAFARGVDNLDALTLTAPFMGALVGYLPYNVYPAKVFNGDTGSLLMGASLGVLAIMTRTEVVTVTAMMPYIVNGFHSLASIGGLLERRSIKVRPTRYDPSTDMIMANSDPRAPVTLVHLLTLRSPLTEREIIAAYLLLFVVTLALSLATALFTY